MHNYIFNGISALDRTTRLAQKADRLRKIFNIRNSVVENETDDEATKRKETELKEIEGFQNLNSEQVQALLGINRKEEYEITTTLKTMILQRRITSGSSESKITPYEDYKDTKGDQKIDFKTKSINHIINVYNLKKGKGKHLILKASLISS